MRVKFLIGLSLLLFASIAHAAFVRVENGTIFYVDDKNTTKVTTLCHVKEAKLHPGGQWIYFVKDGVHQEELIRIKKNGSGAKLLFRSVYTVVDIATVDNIQFSPSGNQVYFETLNWVVSRALHVMNENGTGEKIMGPGFDTRIIASVSDLYKDRIRPGYIVVKQHRYWYMGGGYNYYYIFTPQFREIGCLGDSFDDFTKNGELKYTDHSELSSVCE